MPQPRKYFVNIGDVFGRLTVIGEAALKKGTRYAKCKCECGKVKDVYIPNLSTGKSKSCGCAAHEATAKRNRKHGLCWKENGKMYRLYGVWLGMKRRCYSKNDKGYHRYGGRGIRMCEEWRNNYLSFHEWAMSNGYKPGLTIERKDNSGDYHPDNCTFADMKAQSNNRRSNHVVSYKGKDYTIAELAMMFGINQHTLRDRIVNGFPVEDAVSNPLHHRRYFKKPNNKHD